MSRDKTICGKQISVLVDDVAMEIICASPFGLIRAYEVTELAVEVRPKDNGVTKETEDVQL
jgi:hypothetical protein